MCNPVLYKPISHFQQGVIRSTADVRPYLRASRMALGGSVKRRKISTCGIQRRERTRSRHSWQSKTGSISGDSAIEKASMLLRLCASPANAQFLCVVDQGGVVTVRCRACHSPRIYRVYQKAQHTRRLSPGNALRVHRSACLQLDSLTGGYSVVFCAIIVYITLDSTPTGSRIIQ